MQTTLQASFQLNVSTFARNAFGIAQYQRGLITTSIFYMLDIALEYPGDISADQTQLAHATTQSHIYNYLVQEESKFANAVVVDNDDAFLRNMIPPHNYGILNEMLNDSVTAVFTLDIVPPISRLNFPFIVHLHEKEMQKDLLQMFTTYFNSNMSNLSVRVGTTTFNPVKSVQVSEQHRD